MKIILFIIYTFDNTVYRQKKGLPMVSPISGILAEMKMRILEEQIKVKLVQICS